MIHQQVNWTNFEGHGTRTPQKYIAIQNYSDSVYLFIELCFLKLKTAGLNSLSLRARKKRVGYNARDMTKARYV